MDIKDYIVSARASGQSDIEIRQALLGVGWPEDKINEAFGNFSSPKKSRKKLFAIIFGIVIIIVLLILLFGGFSKNADAPTINSVTITENAGAENYKVGDSVRVNVAFSEKVTVTGKPYITLNIEGNDRNAGYTSGSGSLDLIFSYTITSGDGDINSNEISIKPNSLFLNGGAIRSDSNNDAIITYGAGVGQSSTGDVKSSTSSKYRPGIAMDNFKFTSMNILFTEGEVKDVTPENVDLFFTGLNIDSLKQDWSLYENYYFYGKDEKRFGFSNSDVNLNPYINPIKPTTREPAPALGHITYVDLEKEKELGCVALNGCSEEKGYSMILGFTEYRYEIQDKTTFKKTAFGKELECFKDAESYEKYGWIEFTCLDDNGFDVIRARFDFEDGVARSIWSSVALLYDIRTLNALEKSFVTTPSKISISNNEYDSLDVEFAKKTIISETGALAENVNVESLTPVI